VTAIFDQVPGLPKSADVKAGGVNVGRVASIALKGPHLLPHVTLQIEHGFRLRQGATADLRLYSNSGELNRYIELTQGNGPRLPNGATLGLAFTDQPVEVDQVLSVLNGPTRRHVQDILASLDNATVGRGADFAQTTAYASTSLNNAAELIAQVNADGQALRTVLRDGDGIVSAMAKDPTALGGNADQLAGLLATTAARQTDLAATLQDAAAGLREPRLALERLEQAIPTLRALVPVARAAIGELPATTHELRPTLEVAQPTLREAARLTTTAPADLVALTPVLRTLSPLLKPLTHLMCSAGPILDDLRVSTPEVIGGLTLYGALNANYDANGHSARVYANTSRITGGVLRPDQNQAGLLPKPYLRDPGTNVGQPWTDFAKTFIGGKGKCR
jgi:phospholipid/cholesterol/gamma-HCH transport system substrate-binding protein